MKKVVAYYRVSTKRQGQSGLGLEGQKGAVESHAATAGAKIVASYVEVESGKRKNRPELHQAISHAKMIGATLVVAKLDRLARNVAFLSALMESSVEFLCCDNPHANRLTIHILAAVAEDEAHRISERTKTALQTAKGRGVKLGSNRPGHWKGREDRRQAGLKSARERSIESRQAAARDRLEFLFPKLREMRQDRQSYAAIASELNSQGFTTARGKDWTPTAAMRAVKLAEAAMPG